MATTNTSQLPTPPGYKSLIPFDKEAHRELTIDTDSGYSFASELHAIYLASVEFLQAARHFPIVFSGETDNAAGIVPMVVTGLRTQQNLFVGPDGKWPDDVYVPAYLRRYPFYTAQVRRDSQTEEHMICVDPAGLVKGGKSLLDKDGKASEEWTRMENFIREMELARQQTQRFTEILAEHDLFEPFEAQVHETKAGNEFRIGGMRRISEEKLKGLPGEALQELEKKDYLFLIHLHRMSLDNFRLLLNRVTGNESAAA